MSFVMICTNVWPKKTKLLRFNIRSGGIDLIFSGDRSGSCVEDGRAVVDDVDSLSGVSVVVDVDEDDCCTC